MNPRFKVISVDFDGCITKKNLYPDIGEHYEEAVEVLQAVRKAGGIIVINTCREKEPKDAAIKYLNQHNIPFDYFNENAEYRIKLYIHDSRKIGADLYIDDLCPWFIKLGYVDWKLIREVLEV